MMYKSVEQSFTNSKIITEKLQITVHCTFTSHKVLTSEDILCTRAQNPLNILVYWIQIRIQAAKCRPKIFLTFFFSYYTFQCQQLNPKKSFNSKSSFRIIYCKHKNIPNNIFWKRNQHHLKKYLIAASRFRSALK